MQQTIRQILIKYWNYSKFRPLQEDIILSVLSGKDTLALLPTGGGKSICFQVPALAKEGICIVVSPLIALIKDQVENLKRKNIPAAGIYSGMHYKEIENILENCCYNKDNMKFLYLSPERLETEIFLSRLKRMQVCLLAIDEAHCISQWGYDFRPPYLRIAEIRKIIPNIPVLALTATATPEVVEDIQFRLGFKTPNVFRKSFERKNLTYAVVKEEDKWNRIIRTIRKNKGSGIIYARNRKLTQEIANFLLKNKISADFYHAGLDAKTRDTKQVKWINNETQVIVATNAFGMGIDKPDVRFVIHIDLPDCLEAYFQEAGRGGRDENKALAVLYYTDKDVIDAKTNFEWTYPPLKEIKRVYHSLGSFFQLPVGSGKDARFDFDLNKFCEQYELKPIITFNSLKFLEREGYISMSEALEHPSKLKINVDHDTFYNFIVKNKTFKLLQHTILRMYEGVYNNFVSIYEEDIARKSGLKLEEVVQQLNFLQKNDYLIYIPQSQKPQIIYNTERLDEKQIILSDEVYQKRKEAAEKRLNAVINYVTSKNKCRSQLLINYFGEKDVKRCGNCDVCLERNKLELSNLEFDNIVEVIKPKLKEKPMFLEEIVELIDNQSEQDVINVINWLLDNSKIIKNADGSYQWQSKPSF